MKSDEIKENKEKREITGHRINNGGFEVATLRGPKRVLKQLYLGVE